MGSDLHNSAPCLETDALRKATRKRKKEKFSNTRSGSEVSSFRRLKKAKTADRKKVNDKLNKNNRTAVKAEHEKRHSSLTSQSLDRT